MTIDLNARIRPGEAGWRYFLIDKVSETLIIAPFDRVSLCIVFWGARQTTPRLDVSRNLGLLAKREEAKNGSQEEEEGSEEEGQDRRPDHFEGSGEERSEEVQCRR
jgi:hypothetical protein